MSQKKSLEKIFDSEPSLDENETRFLIQDIDKKKDRWICYGGRWDNLMVDFAEKFINHHAIVPGVLGNIHGSNPIHIGRVLNDQAFGRIDLLLYINGAVIVQTKTPEDREIYVWVDRNTAQVQRYPIPD